MAVNLDQLGNKAFLNETLTYFRTKVTSSGCFQLSPTSKLKENTGPPIAASDLKVGEGGHIMKLNAEEEHVDWLLRALEAVFSHHRRGQQGHLSAYLEPRHASVSGNSKADYSVYVIKKVSAIVAVLMETKLTSHTNFHHALAYRCVRIQLFGLVRG
jgi:hypothetical protein